MPTLDGLRLTKEAYDQTAPEDVVQFIDSVFRVEGFGHIDPDIRNQAEIVQAQLYEWGRDPIFASFQGVAGPGWRRRRDSNPRNSCELNGFQDRRIQPLCHSSAAITVSLRRRRKASLALKLTKTGVRS